jgi:leader peptidase (prepilin peptidase)/N-methyltransferase
VSWSTETATAAAAAAVVGALLGCLVPPLIARVPEPAPEPDPGLEPGSDAGHADGQPAPTDPLRAAPDEADYARPLDDPKEPYAEVAALPGLRWRSALATAVLLGAVAARTGWHPVLLVFAYLVPVCVALSVIDWRTRYLPTYLIAPSYFVVGALCVVASLLTGDWAALETAAIGWIASFVFFFLLNLVYPAGMAYGDVRLAGVLGMALGWLGAGPLILGMYTGFVIGGVGGWVLSALKVFHRRHYPFGPFMALGAWLGIVFTPQLGAAYGWLVNGVAQGLSALTDVLG